MNSYSDEEIQNLTETFWGSSRLDVLINNAGTSRFALFDEQSFSDIREQIHANVELPLLLTRALARQFNADGIILNVGSLSVRLAVRAIAFTVPPRRRFIAFLKRWGESLARLACPYFTSPGVPAPGSIPPLPTP